MTTIQSQKFGVEIELTGITRSQGASLLATFFASRVRRITNGYDTYAASDRKGRTWKCMNDSSIRPVKKVNGRTVPAGTDYRCELVTPVLEYEDMEDLQKIIRLFRSEGAVANESCGIHVHVDGANHTPDSLTRLINFAVGRQDLFYEALQISDRGDRWCKKMNAHLLAAMKHDSIRSRESMERIWYSRVNDQYAGGVDHQHYNTTRYHGVNLHAFFTKGTVEFRLFNGTTHAGKIKAYVQFCLAMSAWAINAKDNLHFMRSSHYESKEQRGKLMMGVLTRRLGMRGPEFKSARIHLTAAFGDEAA